MQCLSTYPSNMPKLKGPFQLLVWVINQTALLFTIISIEKKHTSIANDLKTYKWLFTDDNSQWTSKLFLQSDSHSTNLTMVTARFDDSRVPLRCTFWPIHLHSITNQNRRSLKKNLLTTLKLQPLSNTLHGERIIAYWNIRL